jgi:hypothetical protein
MLRELFCRRGTARAVVMSGTLLAISTPLAWGSGNDTGPAAAPADRDRHRARDHGRRAGRERDRGAECHHHACRGSRDEAGGSQHHRGAAAQRDDQAARRQPGRGAAAYSRNFARDRLRRGTLHQYSRTGLRPQRLDLRGGAFAAFQPGLALRRRARSGLRCLSNRYRWWSRGHQDPTSRHGRRGARWLDQPRAAHRS